MKMIRRFSASRSSMRLGDADDGVDSDDGSGRRRTPRQARAGDPRPMNDLVTMHTGPLGSTIHVLRAGAGAIVELAAIEMSGERPDAEARTST